jgi:hypothetical protein
VGNGNGIGSDDVAVQRRAPFSSPPNFFIAADRLIQVSSLPGIPPSN